MAPLVALALAAFAVTRPARVEAAPAPRPEIVVKHSLKKPAPLPSSPPSGQDARDLWFDTIPQHPGYAITPDRIVSAFRLAELGDPRVQCDLFDDILEPDCHLGSLFEKRAEAVAGKPWVVQSGSHDGNAEAELAAHVAREQLRALPMEEVFQHLLSYNKYGWAAVEVDWGVKEIDGRSWIVPEWLVCVRARRFKVGTIQFLGASATIDELRLYADPGRPLGDPLRPGKWIIVRRDRAFPLAQSGLMRSCIWPAIGKRYGFRDWMIYSEKFGKPLPIASYDETSEDSAKDVASDIIANIGTDNGAVVPKNITVDFKEAKGVDNSHTHGGLIAHCNAEMSKRVNGSTLANDNTNSGGASYALGQVHDSVRWEAVQYDAARIESAFNTQLFAAFVKFNNLSCAPPELKIQVVRDLTPGTRVDVAAIYKNQLGGKLSRTQMAQELGFREPSGTDDELPGAPNATPDVKKTAGTGSQA